MGSNYSNNYANRKYENNNSTYNTISYQNAGLRLSKQNSQLNIIIPYSKGDIIKEESVRYNNNELMTLIIPVDKNNKDKIIGNKPIIYFSRENNSNVQFIYEKENFFEAKRFLIEECNIAADILDDKGDADCGWGINRKSGPKGYLKIIYLQ